MDANKQEENGQQTVEDANSCSDNVKENNMQSLTQNKSSTILIDEDVLDPLMNLSNHASIHISRHRSSRNFGALSTPLRQKTFLDEQSKEIHNMNKEQRTIEGCLVEHFETGTRRRSHRSLGTE